MTSKEAKQKLLKDLSFICRCIECRACKVLIEDSISIVERIRRLELKPEREEK